MRSTGLSTLILAGIAALVGAPLAGSSPRIVPRDIPPADPPCTRADCQCDLTDLASGAGVTYAPNPPATFGALVVGYNAGTANESGCCGDAGEPGTSDDCHQAACIFRLVITATAAQGASPDWTLTLGSGKTTASGATFTWSDQANVSLTCGKGDSHKLFCDRTLVAEIEVKCATCDVTPPPQ